MTQADSGDTRAGVLMVWCDRPSNPQRSPQWGTLDELRVLAEAIIISVRSITPSWTYENCPRQRTRECC